MLDSASDLATSCENGNGTSGSIKGGELTEQWSDC